MWVNLRDLLKTIREYDEKAFSQRDQQVQSRKEYGVLRRSREVIVAGAEEKMERIIRDCIGKVARIRSCRDSRL